MMRCISLLATTLALSLAGCSEDSPEKEDDLSAAPVSRPPPGLAVAAGDVRPALVAEDIEGAALSGELACAFAEHGASSPLLVARADVLDEARAEGVLKLGPTPVRLRAAEAGGFNALVHGAGFTSGDLAARVAVSADASTGGGESPPRPARLEITTPAGTQLIEGTWTCGP